MAGEKLFSGKLANEKLTSDAEQLSGMAVLVTRSPDRAGALVSALEAAGAQALLLPLIDFEAVDFSVDALARGAYSWLVVSSITTVRALKSAAISRGTTLSALLPAQTRVATIGPSSRRVLETEGVRVDLAPEKVQSAAGLIAILPPLSGESVWLPQSDVAAPALAEGLRAAGAEVTVCTAYRTVDYPATNRLTTELAVGLPESGAPMLNLEQARARIANGTLAAVVAASPSAASRIAAALAPLGQVAFIAIGVPTAEQALAEGLKVAATAAQPTPAGIVQALVGVRAEILGKNSILERDQS